MSVADNSILRVAAHFLLSNASDIVNVYHYVMDSTGDVSEANVLTDLLALIQGLMGNLTNYYNDDVSLDEIEVWVRNTTLDRWDYVGSTDGSWAGTVATDQYLPSGVCPLVTADSSDAHAKGRKYLPPPDEGNLSSGLWITNLMNVLGDYLDDYTSTYIGTYAEWAAGIWQETPGTFAQFSGTGKTTNVPAYQRRRKLGVGE